MSKILVVDDEARILLLLQSLLKSNGYEVVTAKSGGEALDVLRSGESLPTLVITDLRMAPMDGLSLIAEIKNLYPKMPIILLTAYASVETAIDAMKCGAFDYLTKPFKVDELLATVGKAEKSVASDMGVVVSDPQEPLRYQFENLIAGSASMVQVCEMIERVSPTVATVLINGESGTGKEVVARTIHNRSPRKEKPWVAVNCAALPENLLESEMFGHVKGAFTGADSDKVGLFETADQGSLFLDEISSMPLSLQGKLLRVLQEKEIRRVGGTTNIPVDVRVIVASNTNLEQMVAQGAFRADLYYRCAVITLDIPPLRDRAEDVLLLARHFIRQEAPPQHTPPELSQETAETLMAYQWPGNVRELENAVKHAMTFWQSGEIAVDLLPPRIVSRSREQRARQSTASMAQAGASLKGFLRQKEKEYLEHILDSTRGDKEKAAETLQVSLATLYRKLADDEGGAES